MSEHSLLLCPFSLQIESMRRLFVLNFRGDRFYEGLELQWFSDERHGEGLGVIMYRKDKHVDVYRSTGLRLEREMFAVGAGLGRWVELDFDRADFDADRRRISADVAFTDSEGRSIELALRSKRDAHDPITLLAPIGADVVAPKSLFLAYTFDFHMMRRADYDLSLHIDGERRPVQGLPFPLGLRRRMMARFTPDPAIVFVNPNEEGPARLLRLGDERGDAEGSFEVSRQSNGSIDALIARDDRHEARFLLGGFPDVRAMEDGDSRRGIWSIAVDDEPAIIEGSWLVRRRGHTVRIDMDVTRGWVPRGLSLPFRVFMRVAAFFRTWPTTYHWSATVDLASTPRIRSEWSRTNAK